MSFYFFNSSVLFLLMFVMLTFFLLIQRNHLLMVLLLFESLTLLLLGVLSWSAASSWMFLLFIVLVFGACEASLGLALITKMVRFTGGDKLSAMAVNKVSYLIYWFRPNLSA